MVNTQSRPATAPGSPRSRRKKKTGRANMSAQCSPSRPPHVHAPAPAAASTSHATEINASRASTRPRPTTQAAVRDQGSPAQRSRMRRRRSRPCRLRSPGRSAARSTRRPSRSRPAPRGGSRPRSDPRGEQQPEETAARTPAGRSRLRFGSVRMRVGGLRRPSRWRGGAHSSPAYAHRRRGSRSVRSGRVGRHEAAIAPSPVADRAFPPDAVGAR